MPRHRRPPTIPVAIALAAASLLLTACTSAGTTIGVAVSPHAQPTHADAPVSTPVTVPSPGVVSDDAATSIAQLGGLKTHAMLQLDTYRRVADFGPAWADVDGQPCDTRDQILMRDLHDIRLSGDCKVVSGILDDPYTGKVIHFVRGIDTSPAVQIDHVVSLANAWVEGAQDLTYAQRELMANDPIELLAVDGPTNQSKGDADASGWLPTQKSFRCTFVERQVAVKVKYHLWVTPAERAAMVRVLHSCLSNVPSAPSTSTPTAAPAPTPSATPTPSASKPTVVPGALCSARGMVGTSAAGRSYVCGRKGADKRGRYHWNVG